MLAVDLCNSLTIAIVDVKSKAKTQFDAERKPKSEDKGYNTVTETERDRVKRSVCLIKTL